jgi:hypothetical protein
LQATKKTGNCPHNQATEAAMTYASEKNGDLSNLFSVQGTDCIHTRTDPKNRVSNQGTGSPGRPVSSGLQVSGDSGNFRERTRNLGKIPNFFLSKCPSIATARISNFLR